MTFALNYLNHQHVGSTVEFSSKFLEEGPLYFGKFLYIFLYAPCHFLFYIMKPQEIITVKRASRLVEREGHFGDDEDR